MQNKYEISQNTFDIISAQQWLFIIILLLFRNISRERERGILREREGVRERARERERERARERAREREIERERERERERESERERETERERDGLDGEHATEPGMSQKCVPLLTSVFPYLLVCSVIY